jgi:hypothetical protein
VSGPHASLLSRLAILVTSLHPERIVRVGIDGAGRTALADALASSPAMTSAEALRLYPPKSTIVGLSP